MLDRARLGRRCAHAEARARRLAARSTTTACSLASRSAGASSSLASFTTSPIGARLGTTHHRPRRTRRIRAASTAPPADPRGRFSQVFDVGSERSSARSAGNEGGCGDHGGEATSVVIGRECLPCSSVASVLDGALRAVTRGDHEAASELVSGRNPTRWKRTVSCKSAVMCIG